MAAFLRHGCQKKSCYDEIGNGIMPNRYPTHETSCVPEFVHACPPSVAVRRPPLPPSLKPLSSLKNNIYNPYQVTLRRKDMTGQLGKLPDENHATAFPSGTKPFCDDCFNFTHPASTFIQNYNIIMSNEFGKQTIDECHIRPTLIFLNGPEYKDFRRRLHLPQKRILNIPSNRMKHWHNYVAQPLRILHAESWRDDCKVPDNWFGPPPAQRS